MCFGGAECSGCEVLEFGSEAGEGSPRSGPVSPKRDISLCRECALRRENVADGLRVGYNQGFVTTVGAVQRIPAGPTRP